MLNPIAPPAVQGIGAYTRAPGASDITFAQFGGYTYEIDLTTNQYLQGQVVAIFTEADFLLRGIVFHSTGLFGIQMQDGQGYFMSNALIYSTNLANSPGEPFPQFPQVEYPAGGQIIFNIQDLSGATNTGQIIFVGGYRYLIPR